MSYPASPLSLFSSPYNSPTNASLTQTTTASTITPIPKTFCNAFGSPTSYATASSLSANKSYSVSTATTVTIASTATTTIQDQTAQKSQSVATSHLPPLTSTTAYSSLQTSFIPLRATSLLPSSPSNFQKTTLPMPLSTKPLHTPMPPQTAATAQTITASLPLFPLQNFSTNLLPIIPPQTASTTQTATAAMPQSTYLQQHSSTPTTAAAASSSFNAVQYNAIEVSKRAFQFLDFGRYVEADRDFSLLSTNNYYFAKSLFELIYMDRVEITTVVMEKLKPISYESDTIKLCNTILQILNFLHTRRYKDAEFLVNGLEAATNPQKAIKLYTVDREVLLAWSRCCAEDAMAKLYASNSTISPKAKKIYATFINIFARYENSQPVMTFPMRYALGYANFVLKDYANALYHMEIFFNDMKRNPNQDATALAYFADKLKSDCFRKVSSLDKKLIAQLMSERYGSATASSKK